MGAWWARVGARRSPIFNDGGDKERAESAEGGDAIDGSAEWTKVYAPTRLRSAKVP